MTNISAPTIKQAEQDWGEKCGVVGIHSSAADDVAPLLYYSLFSLQHRGQESAGISVYCHRRQQSCRHKHLGLLSENFAKEDLERLCGQIGVAHVRYATTGESCVENIQPIESHSRHGPLALAHNGNLTNTAELWRELQEKGLGFASSSDTEIFLKLFLYYARKQDPPKDLGQDLGQSQGQSSSPYPILEYALRRTQDKAQGAYAIVFYVGDKLLVVRDPHGIRPLVIGKRQNPDGSVLHVVASETCALDAIGVPYLRDVEAGEGLIIDRQGMHSLGLERQRSRSLCAFEYIYFARSDSYLERVSVHDTRYRAGQLLFAQELGDCCADMVVGVPDSGLVAAIGYAESSGLPLCAGIVKNRYVARTFIQPDNQQRRRAVKVKFNVVRHLVAGKSVLIIDDSLVRGNTSQLLVQELRGAGAKEVHFRLASPMVLYPCFYGIDFPTREELLAHGKDIETLRCEIGVDSLAFLSLENLTKSAQRTLCQGCFTGQYAGGYYNGHSYQATAIQHTKYI